MSEFDPQEIERVIRKIKHCLALSASANEHEAATALRQAQKLMQKYRLTELDVQLSDVGKSEYEKAKARRPSWDRELSSLVAVTFGCRSYTQSRLSIERLVVLEHVLFVGVSPSHEIAKYAYEALLTKVTLARKQYMSAVRAGLAGRGKYSVETRGNHFAHAWISAVSRKLASLAPEADDLSESQGKALMLSQTQDNALIEQFMFELSNGREPTSRRAGNLAKPNRSDLYAGYLAGEKEELHRGLERGGLEPLALEGQ
jgi:hypothetical protein